MKVRTNEPHVIPFEEATTRLYKVSEVPYVDFAAQALIEAQNRYFAAHPEQRRIANALLWEIEPVDEDLMLGDIRQSVNRDRGRRKALLGAEEEIIERFGSLSIAAIHRIMLAGADNIRGRVAVGVFE